jgi:PleD family two-component response regulator
MFRQARKQREAGDLQEAEKTQELARSKRTDSAWLMNEASKLEVGNEDRNWIGQGVFLSGLCDSYSKDCMGEIDSKNPTVLVVEDNEDTRYFMRLALEHCGYRGCEAANGEQAISIVYREQPAAILMDISMPVLNGLTAPPAFASISTCAVSRSSP